METDSQFTTWYRVLLSTYGTLTVKSFFWSASFLFLYIRRIVRTVRTEDELHLSLVFMVHDCI